MTRLTRRLGTAPAWLVIIALRRGSRLAAALRTAAERAGSRATASPVVATATAEQARIDRFTAALAPSVYELEPNLVHAHDFLTVGIASAVAELRGADGLRVPWIYDAHENVRGLPGLPPARLKAYASHEERFAQDADAVLAVSEPLADLLHQEHRLRERPRVVLNAPLLDSPDEPVETLRSAIGVDPQTPLLVYSGTVKPQRGLETLVRGLAFMPGVECALVTSPRDERHVRRLLELGEELGCRERIHLAPYVAAHQLPAYLRSADVGVHTLLPSGNAAIALPNKLFEYLHAELPLVMSDMPEMRRFVEEHGVGAVFVAGDARGLADACRDVLGRQQEIRATMRALDLRPRYCWEGQVARGLAPLYHALLGAPDTGARSARPRVHLSELPGRGRQRSRLAVGPRNMGGQASAWASAVRTYEELEAESFAYEPDTRFRFPAEIRIRQDDWRSPPWQQVWSEHVVANYSHMLLELGLPALGTRHGRYFDGDLAALRDAEIRVALVLRGSEVRDPRTHRRHEPNSPFDPHDELTSRLQQRVDDLLPRVLAFDGPCFVSTPGLLSYVRGAAWLPLVAPPAVWGDGQPILRRARPVVLHAPTNHKLKGSEHVGRTCALLAREGLIEYREVSGIPPSQMPAVVRGADVVLDQFVLGDYGALACQAMAAGRAVVGHVSDEVRAIFGMSLPIIQATTDSLEDVLRGIVLDRAEAAATAQDGREFASTHHDGRRSAHELARFVTGRMAA